MSTKIRLDFTKTLDIDLLEKGVKVWLIRIVAQVCFKTKDNQWTRPYSAIIDTGAPVSLIPVSIWKEIDVKIFTDYRISGIVPNKGSSIPVKVGNATCTIIDRKASTGDLNINAYLTLTDKVPLIIGFDNLLTDLKLVSDYKTKLAYLET